MITFVLGNGYDSHWVPFFRYCNPCKIHYDVIGKLETGADDFRVGLYLMETEVDKKINYLCLFFYLFKYVWAKTGLISSVSIPSLFFGNINIPLFLFL